jgi:iron-sulfur cluster repair protein YtfE (RIC family)
MLIGVKGRTSPESISDLLLECHGRIRSFVDIARRLAEATDAPVDQIGDAARQVQRYFEEALPLHVEDEEESVLPRLRGQDPQVDSALEKMHQEHSAHEPLLERLIRVCQRLASDPHRHADVAGELAEVVTELDREFGVHLRNEEETIIPAIGRFISAAEQEAMILELRRRRAPPVA